MSEAKSKPVVIIIAPETWQQSLISDLGTLAMVVGIIGIGWWLGSAAMQWAGFVMAAITIVSVTQMRRVRLTIEEARKRLDELEQGK